MNVILNYLMRIKVSSLDQFSLYINEEDIFNSFPGTGNAIASGAVRAMSYRETII